MYYWKSAFDYIGVDRGEQDTESSPVLLPFCKEYYPKDNLTTVQKMAVFKFMISIEESKYIAYETSDNGS